METNHYYDSPQRSEFERARIILYGCHHLGVDINPLCRDQVTKILELRRPQNYFDNVQCLGRSLKSVQAFLHVGHVLPG